MAKTTPDELLLSPAYSVDETIRHNALAPAVADERWKVVAAATDNVERLYLRWHELTEAVVEARQNALASSAKAHAEGKNAPAGAAAKVLQAELEVDGCLEALRAALVDARKARRAYDALWDDPAFVGEYREAVAAEFIKRREAALLAFAELDGNLAALGSLYSSLGDLTLNRLLRDDVSSLTFDGRPIESGGVFLSSNRSWAAPKLAEAMNEVRRFVRNDDPIAGGTLLAEDLETVSAALPELAEQRYDEWQRDLATDRAERFGTMRTNGVRYV